MKPIKPWLAASTAAAVTLFATGCESGDYDDDDDGGHRSSTTTTTVEERRIAAPAYEERQVIRSY